MAAPKRICSVADCESRHHAKGFCQIHYSRMHLRNTLKRTAVECGVPLNWLKEVVADPPDHCAIWGWTASHLGYGQVQYQGKLRQAHRLALCLFTGKPLNYELHALHGSCHNPRCVNPKHLRWGTHRENMADKNRDGTHNKGSSNPMAKLTDSQIQRIRSSKETGETPAILSAELGISRPYFYAIRSGKRRIQI